MGRGYLKASEAGVSIPCRLTSVSFCVVHFCSEYLRLMHLNNQTVKASPFTLPSNYQITTQLALLLLLLHDASNLTTCYALVDSLVRY